MKFFLTRRLNLHISGAGFFVVKADFEKFGRETKISREASGGEIMRMNDGRSMLFGLMAGMLALAGWGAPVAAQTPLYKVLVVMSYEPEFLWAQDTMDGINSALAGKADIRFFHMDTKKNFEGGPAKAQEAYALYQEWQPDGVIAADDDAQKMFVVPYLKDKVNTPVMFCGVNGEAETYGYPALNVSGILERYHFAETIHFARQIDPSIKTVGFMFKFSPTADAAERQVQQETDTYPVKVVGFKKPKTLAEALAMIEELKQAQCDFLCIDALQGLKDDQGNPMVEEEIFPIIIKAFGKPVSGSSRFQMKFGVLCSVIKTGQEHGRVAGEMLLKAMQGTPMSELPITVNKEGKRLINVDALKTLGIKPKPHVLQGVEFIKTEPAKE